MLGFYSPITFVLVLSILVFFQSLCEAFISPLSFDVKKQLPRSTNSAYEYSYIRKNNPSHHRIIIAPLQSNDNDEKKDYSEKNVKEMSNGETGVNTDITTNKERESTNSPIKIVIVGSGWAGYTVAESLSLNTDDVQIMLLDASPNSGGLAGGFKTKTGRNVEAGIHGFWREYKNTFGIMDRIEGVDIDDVLGDYTPSVLYSKNGRVALAPVLGDSYDGDKNSNNEQGSTVKKSIPQQLMEDIIASNPMTMMMNKEKNSSMQSNMGLSQMMLLNKYLPPPLDIALLAKFNPKSPLTPTDRISALGLLGPWVDFQQESSSSWSIYDQYSARVLFQDKAGITETLYEEMIEPLLSVLPMCPDYDCSAAAVLSCFHVFALQSKGAFDVKWCRGSIREKIFDPWSEQLARRGVDIRYNSRVTSVIKNDDDNANGEKARNKFNIQLSQNPNSEEVENESSIDCDAIIFAVGGIAMGKITANSPALSNLSSVNQRDNFEKLRGVTCVAVRLFIQPDETITSGLDGGEYDSTQLPPDLAKAMKDSPIAVCGPNPLIGGGKMTETGFCIYDLQRMHDEFSVEMNKGNIDAVAVLEVDFYRADEFVNMNDEEIAQLALETVATTFNTKQIDMEKLVDVSVVRARNAVSHFAPKSASYSPDVKLGDGLYICGDWIDRSGHASWSTEKAVVTGIQSAARLSEDFQLKQTYCDIINAAEDTEQLRNLRELAKTLRSVAPPPGGIPPSPWMFAKEILTSRM